MGWRLRLAVADLTEPDTEAADVPAGPAILKSVSPAVGGSGRLEAARPSLGERR